MMPPIKKPILKKRVPYSRKQTQKGFGSKSKGVSSTSKTSTKKSKNSSKNPISYGGEKSKVVFKELIPTLRKIQNKKYKQNIAVEKQRTRQLNNELRTLTSMMERRFYSRDPRTCKRQPFSFSELSPKVQKDINRYFRLKLNKINLNEITPQQRNQIVTEVRNILFKVRTKNSNRMLISKQGAKNELIGDLTENNYVRYNKLKARDRKKINTIINNNTSLLTENTYLTAKMYEQLRENVMSEIQNLNLNYIIIGSIKESILSDPIVENRFKHLSNLEKKRKLKYLDKLIISTHNYRTPSGQRKIQKSFFVNLMGLNKKKR